jgi:pimeloyl-ACP methyl ester carboxylesterase
MSTTISVQPAATPARRAWRSLARAGAIALGVYAALLALLWWQQERLLFAPQVLAPDHRFALGADVHERYVDVPGARLHALHLKLPAPRGVVFFLHGNSGSLDNWFVNLEFYRRANYDLFMFDYRGYGKSGGHVTSEAQLHADARVAWDLLAPEYVGKKLVLYGRSLGTALAARLGADVEPDLTVLVSPYESMRALAAEVYPWVPSAVLRYPLDTAAAVSRLRRPLWLVHGEADTLIPARHSHALQRAQPSATLHIVPGAGHNDLQEFEDYRAALRRAFDAI